VILRLQKTSCVHTKHELAYGIMFHTWIEWSKTQKCESTRVDVDGNSCKEMSNKQLVFFLKWNINHSNRFFVTCVTSHLIGRIIQRRIIFRWSRKSRFTIILIKPGYSSKHTSELVEENHKLSVTVADLWVETGYLNLKNAGRTAVYSIRTLVA
jgi:hypothetical protein